jgi:hypothetical protein
VAVEDGLGEVEQFSARVLGVLAEHLEGGVVAAAVSFHQDALGPFDHSAAPERALQVLSESALLCARLEDFASRSTTTLTGLIADAPPELNDRAADVWEPLLAIADIVGGDWPDRARTAAVELSTTDEPDPGIQLLADVHTVFDSQHRQRIRSSEVLAGLRELEDASYEGDYRLMSRSSLLGCSRTSASRRRCCASELRPAEGTSGRHSLTVGHGIWT